MPKMKLQRLTLDIYFTNAGANSFNRDISSWDVSSGQQFDSMFAGKTSSIIRPVEPHASPQTLTQRIVFVYL
jgi:hypothetical protein